MTFDVLNSSIYRHPGGVPTFYIDERRAVFEHGTYRKVYYIDDLTVYDLRGNAVFTISDNYLLPCDGSYPDLYFHAPYKPAQPKGHGAGGADNNAEGDKLIAEWRRRQDRGE